MGTKDAPKEYRDLSCKLTGEELRNYSDTLAAKTAERSELEDAKKQASSNYKARIDAIEAENNLLARKIQTRSENRQVECAWEFDWEDGIAHLRRNDTWELVDKKKITDFDRQQFFVIPQEEEAIEQETGVDVGEPGRAESEIEQAGAPAEATT